MPDSYPFSRRRFLAGAGAAAVGATAGGIAGPVLLDRPALAAARSTAGGPLPPDVFTLGVASGDPLPDGVVLWTRLAPSPVEGGGMPDRNVAVDWEIADDPRFRRVRRRGEALARPRLGHSVHVEVGGLAPDREYYYRFRAAGQLSPAGRTRTAPAVGRPVRGLRFAFASCQSWQDGFYTAYPHMIEEDLAFCAFVGDYIYETPPSATGVRRHEGAGEPITLVQYRNRHAQYKTDPNLQAAHAAMPWIVTLDDHEIDNNWADEIPQDPDNQTPEAFRARRAAALQAYYEHMPLRRSSLPDGLDMQLYRRFRFGNLAAVHVLDTRQYRSDQPANLDEANDPDRSMTGMEQERWLVEGMTGSRTRWNLLANQVMWAQNDRTAGPVETFDLDNWDGYRAQRRRLLELFGSGRTRNPVVLTGDRHATWACDLKPDFDDEASPVVGAEITGSSISSGGDGNNAGFHQRFDPIMADSPHWKYIDGRRAYVVCDLTAERMLATLRVLPVVSQPSSAAQTAAEFVVEAGRPGIEVVSSEAVPTAPAPASGTPMAPDNDQPLGLGASSIPS